MTENHRFNSVRQPNASSKCLREITQTIRPLIQNTVSNLVTTYQLAFIMEPFDYVVRAIWGPQQKGVLDENQQRINHEVDALVDTIQNLLETSQLSASRRFAIEFLVRELLLTKLQYMVEMAKIMLLEQADPHEGRQCSERIDLLSAIEPIGNA